MTKNKHWKPGDACCFPNPDDILGLRRNGTIVHIMQNMQDNSEPDTAIIEDAAGEYHLVYTMFLR